MSDETTNERSVVELDGLTVRLGRQLVLDELTGRMSGRAVGLLGPNGAGKTTLVHTLLGFYPPTGGTARILGYDARRDSTTIRRMVGHMPESDTFLGDMTAVAMVRLLGEVSGLPSSTALERAHEALFFVGLGEARYRTLDSYSQGMKQRAKLAQALVHGPRLLFLDEPTNGLDPPARRTMLELIRSIRDGGETTVVLSSHLLRDVEETCDEVVILKDGRFVARCDLEAQRRGDRRFVELEITGDEEGFVTRLSALGCQAAVMGHGRIKTVLPDGVDTPELYRLAGELEVRIRRLDRRRDSLQDIFLQAMEA